MTDIVVEVDQAAIAEMEVSSAVIVALNVSAGIGGPTGPPGTPATGNASLTFHQGVADDVWTIVHNLGYYPNVTTVDSSGDVIEGDVSYIDVTTLTVTFSALISGTAYLS